MNRLWVRIAWPGALWHTCLLTNLPAWVYIAGFHPFVLLLVGGYSFGTLVGFFRSRCLFRLLWRTRRFWSVRRGSVVLYYSPERTDAPAVLSTLNCCDSALEDLGRQFGFRLRSKVVVVLLENAQEATEIRGQSCGGFALPFRNTIVVNQEHDLMEVVRHELVHVYAARWDECAAPLLAEGLATWLQTPWGRADLDDQARRLLIESGWPLDSLLDRSFFFGPENQAACYTLAASFSGFFIRRYGWDRYRKVYKGARRNGLSNMLSKQVGLKLSDLERLWREELGAPANPSVA